VMAAIPTQTPVRAGVEIRSARALTGPPGPSA
jgi:hypothetical protein